MIYEKLNGFFKYLLLNNMLLPIVSLKYYLTRNGDERVIKTLSLETNIFFISSDILKK